MRVLSRGLPLFGVLTFAFGTGAVPGLVVQATPNQPPAGFSAQPLELANRGLFRVQTVAQADSRVLWADQAKVAHARRGATAEERARSYLAHYAQGLALSPAASAGTVVTQARKIGTNGDLVVFGQRVGELEVYGARSAVLMNARGDLVALSGELHPSLRARSNYTFKLAQDAAIAQALATHFAVSAAAVEVAVDSRKSGQYSHFALRKSSKALAVSSAIRSKPLLFARSATTLEPAYYVEFYGHNSATSREELFGLLVSANDAAILKTLHLTSDDAFKYRVWAEESRAHTPMDGPAADYTPHATGKPDKSLPGSADPSLIEIDGLNHNPDNASDPWLPAGATQTRGNNVDAYSDRDQTNDTTNNTSTNDGLTGSDMRATTTSAGTFDRVFNVSKDASEGDEQIMASITQLFYVNNWLHDYWYDSGFDEGAGNAQNDNFGRGGADGDPVQAQAQDSADEGQRNNANMSTPADGNSPRMQMYLWTNADILRALTPDPKPSGWSDLTGQSQFGPADFKVSGELVLANDGVDPVTDGCEDSTVDVEGKIVLVEIGPITGTASKCRAVARAKIAQDAGAKALVFIGNAATAPALGNDPAANVTIPGMGLSKPDGDLLIAALDKGETVTVTMERQSNYELDGTIDNQIVAHEWGHYLHHRLVPACSAPSCSSMSEGWGDYVAWHMTHRETDAADGLYAMAGYATRSMSENNYYFGIRRYPYSTQLTVSPLTFKYITNGVVLPAGIPTLGASPDNAEVHNAGEIWAAAMMQASQELFNATRGANPRLSYEDAKRRLADYVVAGMQAAPSEPTFTEQRDAVLAAAMANDPLDYAAMAAGFATRGLGSCAVAPPATSMDNSEAEEAFGLSGRLHFTGFSLTDTEQSCNDDGNLDVGEEGELVLHLFNAGSGAIENGKVTLTVDGDALDLDSLEVDIPTIDSMSSGDVAIPATLAAKVSGVQEIKISAQFDAEDSCENSIAVDFVVLANVGSKTKASVEDDVEAEKSAWTVEQDAGMGDDAWVRAPMLAHDHSKWAWYGHNLAVAGETSLVSPAIEVSDSETFVVSLRQAYSFDDDHRAGAELRHVDGGVIEISTDKGKTWKDASEYGDVAYSGKIDADSDHPLQDREAFVGSSAEFPKLADIELDFGDKLAGETVQLRLRIGSDEAVGAIGWIVDDITLSGATNKPFSERVDEDDACDNTDTDTDNTDDSSDDDDDDDNDSSGDDDDDDDSASDDDDDSASDDDDDDDNDNASGDDDDDTSDDDDDNSETGTDTGCGCAATPRQNLLGLGLVGVLALGLRRRRRN